MCKRNEIECYLSGECTELCEQMESWADRDYVCQNDMMFAEGELEVIAHRQSSSRLQPVREGWTCNNLGIHKLRPKQQEAIFEVFYHPSGERQSVRTVARRLGITKNAVHCRLQSALRHIRRFITEKPGRIAKGEQDRYPTRMMNEIFATA